MLSLFLVFFVVLGAVSAADNSTSNEDFQLNSYEDSDLIQEGETDTLQNEDIEPLSDDDDDDDDDAIETSLQIIDTTIINDGDLSVKLTDGDGNPIAKSKVRITLNDVVSRVSTDAKGIAKLKVNVTPGIYTVKCSFSKDGYESSYVSKKITVLSTGVSKFKASNYIAYIGAKNPFTVTLTADGVPLSGKIVTFNINGKSYDVKTDSNGKASLNINLPKGKYTMEYSYAGGKNIKSASGSKTVTVKKGVPVKISKYGSQTYIDYKLGKFQVKVVDVRGSPIAGKKVKFIFKKKTYVRKTDKKGIANLKVKLPTGSYKIKVISDKTSKYNKKSKTYTIKVKSSTKPGGVWLFAGDMKKVSLKNFKKYGVNHVFLNSVAIEKFGQSYVESWIKTAKSYGMKVHLWVQVFYKGGKWINPVKNGKINYNLINSKVTEILKFTEVKGVSGIHFDYLRYPGTAYKYKNSVNAVNYFTKTASKAIHAVNSKLIVSAAVMPESMYSMKTYYGQDIPTMSKYLDVIVPMVYKGNYHAGTKWIKSTTQSFVKNSQHAKIWVGLQSYKSDSDVSRLPTSELINDGQAAVSGGSTGIVLFRYGLINFKEFY